MNEPSTQHPEVQPPAPPEQVMIEDYRGPLVGVPPPVPDEAQMIAANEVKPEVEAAPLSRNADGIEHCATFGTVFGGFAVGGLLATLRNNFLFSNSLHPGLHDVLFSPIVVIIIGLSILGLVLCAAALAKYRTARHPNRVLKLGRAGLTMNILGLLLALLLYASGA